MYHPIIIFFYSDSTSVIYIHSKVQSNIIRTYYETTSPQTHLQFNRTSMASRIITLLDRVKIDPLDHKIELVLATTSMGEKLGHVLGLAFEVGAYSVLHFCVTQVYLSMFSIGVCCS